jgi:hypothetical protein
MASLPPVSGTAPTLHQLTNLANRGGLVSALTMLEAIQSQLTGPEGCAEWIRETLGIRVDRISEGAAGSVALDGSTAPDRAARFQRLAEAARLEVVRTLRGLLARPQDDAFVARALYEQRVQRETRGRTVVWVPRPTGDDKLSTLLLLLFIVDILGNRDGYDSRLSICDDCGRLSFVERRTARFGCSRHPVT